MYSWPWNKSKFQASQPGTKFCSKNRIKYPEYIENIQNLKKKKPSYVWKIDQNDTTSTQLLTKRALKRLNFFHKNVKRFSECTKNWSKRYLTSWRLARNFYCPWHIIIESNRNMSIISFSFHYSSEIHLTWSQKGDQKRLLENGL